MLPFRIRYSLSVNNKLILSSGFPYRFSRVEGPIEPIYNPFYAPLIPHRCPKCFESVTLIQPQYKGGAFKGPAKGQCLNCMDEQEYDLTVPAKEIFLS